MSDFSVVFLPSWPHIHFAFSSIPRPVIHFFPIFCHHMLYLAFVLMYHACTEIWTLDLEIKSFLLYQTKLYRRFPGFILNAPDVIRTRDIRVKSPLPYRLATDANQYSVFGISPSVFVLFFSLSLSPFFFFLYVPDINVGNISWHGGARTHDTLVNGQVLYLLSYAPIFLYGQSLHPSITYSEDYMSSGAYGNRTRRLLLAKQASPHCD